MGLSKFANGFYSHSDSYLKSMNKKDLICHIRTIEKNWENALITNDIQYHNCKRLLAEERNKAIDEFVDRLEKYEQENWVNHLEYGINWSDIEHIVQEMKAGGTICK